MFVNYSDTIIIINSSYNGNGKSLRTVGISFAGNEISLKITGDFLRVCLVWEPTRMECHGYIPEERVGSITLFGRLENCNGLILFSCLV